MISISAYNKNYACAGQLIVTTPIQAVKLPITTVTRLPLSSDENELELWNVELWRLKKLLWKPYKSDYIQSFLNLPIKHVKEKKKKFDCNRKRTFFYLNLSSIATLKKQR